MYYQPLVVKEIPYRTHIGRAGTGFWHWHSEMELLICLKGSMRMEFEDRVFTLSAGDALIIPACCAHSSSRLCEDQWRAAFIFGYSLLSKQFASIQDVCLYIPAGDPKYRALQPPLDALKEIFSQDATVTEENEWHIRGNLFLLCQTLRTMEESHTLSVEQRFRAQRLETIYTVLEYVRKHYREKITVEQMATLAGYSKTYFCRQFKNITGTSFYRYLTCYRISVACMLMEEHHNSMSHIAQSTGFASLPLFSRAFKEITGMTPSQFQNLPQEDKNFIWVN